MRIKVGIGDELNPMHSPKYVFFLLVKCYLDFCSNKKGVKW